MKAQSSLFKNTALLGVAAFLGKAVTFLCMPFYTAALSPADFGTADILVSTALLLLPFVSLNMPEAVFRFLAGGEREEREVLTTAMLLVALGIIAFALLLPLTSSFALLSRYRYYLFFYVLASLLRNLFSQVLRARGQYGAYAVQQLACALLTVLLQLLLLWGADMGASGYVLGVILGDGTVALALLLYLRPWRRLSFGAINRRGAGKLLSYALPLMPTAVLWWVTSISDRYFLLHYYGTAVMGIYAAASRIPVALTFFMGIFLEAWHYTAIGTGQGQRAMRYGQVYGHLLAVGVFALALMLAGLYPAVQVVYAPEYREVITIIPFLALSALFSVLSNFFSSIYSVHLRSGASLLTALFGAVLNFVLNFLLIPRFGGVGAAIATLLSYFAVFFLRAWHTRSYLAFPRHAAKLLISGGYLILAALCVLFGEYLLALLPSVLAPMPFSLEGIDLLALLAQRVCHIFKKRPKTANRY